MSQPIRPKVLISKCLEHDNCRYNGDIIRHGFIDRLKKYVEFLPVCPEMEIGLGVPRDPLRLVLVDGKVEMFQPNTEKWVTESMERFCSRHLEQPVLYDGFILKNRSPSCGIFDVKIFQGTSKSAGSRKGNGMFGEAIRRRFENYPVEDEGRLNNLYIREHFLTVLYAIAKFREVQKTGELSALLKFHQNHKLLFMAYNQTAARRLGQICANQENLPFQELSEHYFTALRQIFSKPPKFTSMINALMHAFGGISDGLNAGEKSHFLQSIEEYRDERIPLSPLIYLLQAWAIRFENRYLQDQVLLNPFPSGLIDKINTGKKRF